MDETGSALLTRARCRRRWRLAYDPGCAKNKDLAASLGRRAARTSANELPLLHYTIARLQSWNVLLMLEYRAAVTVQIVNRRSP